MRRFSSTSYRTPYNDNYETCSRTTANLLIYTGELDPGLVSDALGIGPSSLTRKGEEVVNSLGRVRTERLNLWELSSEGQIESLDVRRHLDWLLDHIEPCAEGLSRVQAWPEARVNVSCPWWSKGMGGPALWPIQMRRIADLNLELAFDVMMFDDDDSEG